MPSPNIEPPSDPSLLPQQWTASPKVLDAKEEHAQGELSSNGVQPNIMSGAVRSNDTIQEGKQKAKAVVAASGSLLQIRQ